MTDEDLLRDVLDLDARVDRLEADEGEPANPVPPGTWDELLAKNGEPAARFPAAVTTADNIVAAFAGLCGGLIDLRSRIEQGLTRPELHEKYDAAFKERLRQVTRSDRTIAIDNAKGGPWHRLVGPTHDAARLFETIRCVQKGEFRSAVHGVLLRKASYREGLAPYAAVEDPGQALILVLMHWFADFFSQLSLPIPGWSLLAEHDSREIVEWAFRCYREGANLRALASQLASNLSGVALIELVLHIYRYLDMFAIERRPFDLELLSLRTDVRFRWAARNGHLSAFAISSGAAIVVADPFKLNYAAFMRFYAHANAIESLLGAQLSEVDRRISVLIDDLQPVPDV